MWVFFSLLDQHIFLEGLQQLAFKSDTYFTYKLLKICFAFILSVLIKMPFTVV